MSIRNEGSTVSTVTAERQETIKEIVCDILEIEPDDVTQESLFKEDHDADSLRAIEILASLEKAFNVVINQSELGRMVNLKGVYEVVAESADWK
ncbi:polyketide-8 synthase acyl carrier protein [Streptomyces sp. MMG1522]|nr:polyketide-8 synthase acyl carrier protein [Streptomyces sp. NRRL F-2295]KOU46662.1 polyketide-8 synthase acyl carrier protein [Streptomyces sp. MMG1522]